MTSCQKKYDYIFLFVYKTNQIFTLASQIPYFYIFNLVSRSLKFRNQSKSILNKLNQFQTFKKLLFKYLRIYCRTIIINANELTLHNASCDCTIISSCSFLFVLAQKKSVTGEPSSAKETM